MKSIVIATVLWLGLSVSSIASGPLSFARTDYPVGTNPISVYAADFDGDGKLDLAVVNFGSNTVSILKNNGDGTLAAGVNYSVGVYPQYVIAADFDGDGKLDLVVVNHGSNSVSILRNNGDGTFATAVNYSVGNTPECVTVADFNGDGKLDLGVANYYSNTVSILTNNGDGTFAAAVNYNVGTYPHSLFAADFDGNGKPDIAAANYGSNTVSILKNNGDGTFASALNYGVGNGPASVFAADFDGDGKIDIAVSDYGAGTVSILRNNGDGTFATAVNYGVGDSPYGVYAADFDGDGKLDLAVANNGSNSVSLLTNNGDGTFATAVNYGVGYHPIPVFAADLNGDGKPDLAVGNYSANTVSILLSEPYVTPKTIHIPADQPTIQAGINAAFDGDTVLVSPGLYIENISFQGKKILVTSSAGPDSTTIKAADPSHPVVSFSNYEPKGAVLRGFTVTGSGYGGIECLSSSPTIIGNHVVGNRSTRQNNSPGISLKNTVGSLIRGNIVAYDTAYAYGPGMHLGDNGMSTQNDTICFNLFYGDIGVDDIRILGSVTDLKIFNNTIASPTNWGIGINASGTIDIRNNIITGVAANYAIGMVGATGTYLCEYNCLFNDPGNFYNVQVGSGNVLADPLYADESGHNYALLGGSQCIDAGDPNPIYNDPDGTRNDMGAYPFTLNGPYAQGFGIVGADPTHIVNLSPKLGWHLVHNTGPQTALSIELGTNPLWASGILWNIDSLASRDSTIVYAGQALSKGVDYYARVRLHDSTQWGGWVQTKFHTNSAPSVPVLNSPSANAVVGASPTLSVQNSTDLENDVLWYDFQVAADSGLTNLEFSASRVASGSGNTSWQVPGTLTENVRHWWRARAWDSYDSSAWSTARVFWEDAVPDPPTPPVLVYPQASTNIPVYTMFPTLIWKSSFANPLDSIRYKLEFSLSKTFLTPYIKDSIVDTTWTPPDSLDFGTHYYWRITARDNRYGLSTRSLTQSDFWTWQLGDLNNSHVCDLGDLSMLVSYLTGGGAVIVPKMAGDLNGDCKIDLSDLSRLVSYLAGGGAQLLPGCQGPGQIVIDNGHLTTGKMKLEASRATSTVLKK